MVIGRREPLLTLGLKVLWIGMEIRSLSAVMGMKRFMLGSTGWSGGAFVQVLVNSLKLTLENAEMSNWSARCATMSLSYQNRRWPTLTATCFALREMILSHSKRYGMRTTTSLCNYKLYHLPWMRPLRSWMSSTASHLRKLERRSSTKSPTLPKIRRIPLTK